MAFIMANASEIAQFTLQVAEARAAAWAADDASLLGATSTSCPGIPWSEWDFDKQAQTCLDGGCMIHSPTVGFNTCVPPGDNNSCSTLTTNLENWGIKGNWKAGTHWGDHNGTIMNTLCNGWGRINEIQSQCGIRVENGKNVCAPCSAGHDQNMPGCPGFVND